MVAAERLSLVAAGTAVAGFIAESGGSQGKIMLCVQATLSFDPNRWETHDFW